MGHRTLKRVPLNFAAPLGKVWKGYINPYPGPLTCDLCDGNGYNTATKQIADDFYSFDDRRRAWSDKITQDEVQALVNQNRLIDFTHTWKQGEGWKPKQWETKGFWCQNCYVAVPQLSPEHLTALCTGCDSSMLLLDGNDPRLHIPTAEEVNAYQHKGGLGRHDAINRFILIEARAKRLGVWGKCHACKGKGEIPHPDPQMRKRHGQWRPHEPPHGKGYQLWETCSEGSPVSPVFASAEELADWCAENATIFGDEKTSRENWLKMFVGEEDLDMGNLLVIQPGYFGALANASKNEPKSS